MKTPTRIAAHLGLTAVSFLVVLTPANAAREHTMGAFFIDYAPDPLTINEGDTITFVNTDPFAGVGHSFTQGTPEGVAPKFDTGVIAPGASAEVKGISDLRQGEYLIQCTVHAPMRGHLFVGAPARPPTEAVTEFIDSVLN